jgi:hypothetical protein
MRTRQIAVPMEVVEERRQLFENDLLRFERILIRASDDRGWSEYLQLAPLKTAISDLGALATEWQRVDQVPERWRLASMIWPVVELQQAAASLERLAAKTRIFSDPHFAAERMAKLSQLAAHLNTSEQLPPGEVATICHWLRQRDSDRSLVAGIERRFVHPNLVFRLPAAALPVQLNSHVDETFPVDDVIVGTRVRGHGRLTGQQTGRFLPSVGHGVLELTLHGESVASTTGHQRNAVIRSTSVTRLQGTKHVLIDPGGLRPLPASTQAKTQISYDSIGGPNTRYGREVRSRVYASRAQAEWESARKAAAYVNSSWNEAVDPLVATWNHELRQRFLLPLVSRQAWPQTDDLRSDDSGLTIALVQRLPDQFGAPYPPPDIESENAQLLIHASFISRLTSRLVQGRTYAGEQLLRPEPSSDTGTFPPETSAAESWSLTFAESSPVAVDFSDDMVSITVRLASFQADDREYSGMDISAKYRLDVADGQLRMVGEGELLVYPAGFIRGEQRLSGPQLVARQILKRRLEAHLPAEFRLENLFGFDESWAVECLGCSTYRGWLRLDLSLADR